MADKKISALTSATLPLAGTEVLPIVQSSTTDNITVNNLAAGNLKSQSTTGVLQVSGPTAGTTRVMTTPDANFTAARTDASQTFTGDQTFSNNVSLNATLSSWGSNFRAVQIGLAGAVAAQTGAKTLELATNAYNNSGWKYQASDYASIYYQYGGGHYWGVAASGTKDAAITFTQAMQIANSGGVSIGNTTDPGAGNLSVTGSTQTDGLVSHAGTGGAYQSNKFNFEWTGSPALWVDSTNLGNIQLSSDYRIKHNVQTQNAPALERILRLRPVTYELTNYGGLFKADGVKREGFIAHEVQEVIPSGAEGQKDEESRIQNLRVDAILSVVVKAMQEQQQQIESLKAEVAALKGV